MALNDQQIQDAIIKLFQLIGASHVPSELQNINTAPDKQHFIHIQKGEADGQRINIEQVRGFFGDYNPTTNTPALSNTTGTEGTYYVVTENGSKDFGNGIVSLAAGDILEFKGGKWDKITKNTQGDKHYVHEQNAAATEWVVEHNLSKFPAVTVLDSAGSEIEGHITHDSLNTLTISFNSSFSGTATIN